MKFGDHLQQEIFPPWQLKTRQLDHQWNGEDEDEFINKLENELEKVYDFVSAKLSEVEARISYCERTIQTFIDNPSWSSDQNWTLMNDALTEVLFDVNDLAKFTRLNYIGFQKIIKKHDKWTGLNLKQDFIPQLRNKPLDKQRFDVAIVFISALHDICRQRGKPRPSSTYTTNSQISSTDKSIVKYWIHPDNITEVKSIIMLHLPVSIYNKEKRYEASDSAISSIYFDNEEFGLYTGLLQRDEGAEAIRFKWHGPTSTPDVYLERCTYHAEWADGQSIKERIEFVSDDVSKFIKGALTAEEYTNRLRAKGMNANLVDDCQFISSGVEKSIAEKKLKPMCRVFYNRTTFQLPEDPDVCIHVDNDLTFIREDNFDGIIRRGLDDWRRPDVGIDYPFSYLDESDVLRFPYAVLESKVEKKPPAWLTKLLSSHLVHEVPHFSKYLHGASYLFRDRIPLLPWWLSEMEIDIRKPRATNFGLSRSKSFQPLIDGQYRRAMEAEQLRMDLVNETVQMEKKSMESLNSGRSSEKLINNNDIKKSPSNDGVELIDVNTNIVTRSDSSNWNNRPHRMQSTLVVKGDDPLNYGPINRKSINPDEMSALGEEIIFNNGETSSGKNEKGGKKLFENTNMYVKDPNNPNNVIPVKKVKVEPKVFFSNERTFISWLQFCALLLSVALNLLNFGDLVSRIAGAIFIGISAGIAIYALFQFERRAWMINRRIVGRYDDLWGPAVLCILLVAALAVNFYLRFR
ncbi:VTC domain-containing protein [Cokeromyces recurvatus]|uniref:VTC domain-containing protein n=1 Tax=Cokeromyces recurvatus TaxID=90255 RepID=UPI0022205EA7|nr:VTC domain-containing protein [Cokeromyces recurvatus]KAI7905230.1 VTC domain-containing protein [Cokeromyces recurvatus]